jgi:hypothetical protein
MYTAAGERDYIAEKAEGNTGWLFPVGDETGSLGYNDMFTDALDSLDAGRQPAETFYDGYIVNAIIDAAYASIQNRQWQPIDLTIWRGPSGTVPFSVVRGGKGDCPPLTSARDYDADHVLLKQERMPDGATKLILRNKHTGQVIHHIS